MDEGVKRVEISGVEILLAITSALVGLTFLFLRQWMSEKTDQLSELFSVVRKLRTVQDCQEHRERTRRDIEILRTRTHDQANEIQQRVEWEYCRDCPKRKD